MGKTKVREGFFMMPRSIDSDERLTVSARSVLMALASRANADGECWPSLATIAKDAKVSNRTTVTAIKQLVECGYISKEKRENDSQGHASNKYKLLFDRAGKDSHIAQGRAYSAQGLCKIAPPPYATDAQGLCKIAPRSKDNEVKTLEVKKEEVPPKSPTGGQARHEYSDDFEKFWKLYPRKAGKRAAYKAFNKALKRVDLDTIMTATQRYAADPNREPQYTAHASTWLNQDRWEDEPLPQRRVPDPWGDRVRAALVVGQQPPPQQAIVNGYPPRVIEPGGDYDYL